MFSTWGPTLFLTPSPMFPLHLLAILLPGAQVSPGSGAFAPVVPPAGVFSPPLPSLPKSSHLSNAFSPQDPTPVYPLPQSAPIPDHSERPGSCLAILITLVNTGHLRVNYLCLPACLLPCPVTSAWQKLSRTKPCCVPFHQSSGTIMEEKAESLQGPEVPGKMKHCLWDTIGWLLWWTRSSCSFPCKTDSTHTEERGLRRPHP